jgi:hypothetical protein
MCECKNVLIINSRAKDGHWWRLPNGTIGEGYNPFWSFEGGDDFEVSLCVDCGKIQKLNLEQLRNEIKELNDWENERNRRNESG